MTRRPRSDHRGYGGSLLDTQGHLISGLWRCRRSSGRGPKSLRPISRPPALPERMLAGTRVDLPAGASAASRRRPAHLGRSRRCGAFAALDSDDDPSVTVRLDRNHRTGEGADAETQPLDDTGDDNPAASIVTGPPWALPNGRLRVDRAGRDGVDRTPRSRFRGRVHA